jgi:hypothetical protein
LDDLPTTTKEKVVEIFAAKNEAKNYSTFFSIECID